MFEDYVWDDIYGQRTEDGGDDPRAKLKQKEQRQDLICQKGGRKPRFC